MIQIWDVKEGKIMEPVPESISLLISFRSRSPKERGYQILEYYLKYCIRRRGLGIVLDFSFWMGHLFGIMDRRR